MLLKVTERRKTGSTWGLLRSSWVPTCPDELTASASSAGLVVFGVAHEDHLIWLKAQRFNDWLATLSCSIEGIAKERNLGSPPEPVEFGVARDGMLI